VTRKRSVIIIPSELHNILLITSCVADAMQFYQIPVSIFLTIQFTRRLHLYHFL